MSTGNYLKKVNPNQHIGYLKQINSNEMKKIVTPGFNKENELIRYKKFISRNKVINGIEREDCKRRVSLNNSRIQGKVKLNVTYLPLEGKANKTEDELNISNNDSLFHLNIFKPRGIIRNNSKKKLPEINSEGKEKVIMNYKDKHQYNPNHILNDNNHKHNSVKIKVKNLMNLQNIINTQKNTNPNSNPILKRPASTGKVKMRQNLNLLNRNMNNSNINIVTNKLTFNNSFLPITDNNLDNSHLITENRNSNVNIFDLHMNTENKDDSFNSSLSFINQTDIFEKTANFSFVTQIHENSNKNSNESKNNNGKDNVDDIFEKLNKITIKEVSDANTPQETQVESTPMTDKNVKVRSKGGFTFREESSDNDKKTENNKISNNYSNVDRILEKKLEKNIDKIKKNAITPDVNNKHSLLPQFKIKSKITPMKNPINFPNNRLKMYNQNRKLLEIHKAPGVSIKELNHSSNHINNNINYKIKTTSKDTNKITNNSTLNDEDYNFNSLKSLIEVTKNRIDSPPEDKKAYTESNRISLNDSIRKNHNASPKLMKAHPDLKIFFEN